MSTNSVSNQLPTVHQPFLGVPHNKLLALTLLVLLTTLNVLFQMVAVSNSHTRELMENVTLLLSLDLER